MNHLRARRLLAWLPDGGLAPRVEQRVRAHADRCVRCQRILAEHAAVDRLLRTIPEGLLPAKPSASAEVSLGLLARWFGPERVPWFERLPIHPIGASLTAGALLLGVIWLTPAFVVETGEPFNAVVVAAAHHPARMERPRRSGPAALPTLREHSGENYLLPVAAR